MKIFAKVIEVAELEAQAINQIGKCTLINEDCITAMDKLIAEGIKVDCILTDPPYEYGSIGGVIPSYQNVRRK